GLGPALERAMQAAPAGEAGRAFRESIGELRGRLDEGVRQAEAGRGALVQAGLGQVLYVYDAVDMPLPPGAPSVGLIAAAPREGASAEALRPALPFPDWMAEPQVVDGVLVTGRGFAVERALREDNQPRADLIEAFESMIEVDTVAAAVISPTEDHRRAFRSALPELYTADPASEPERLLRLVFEDLRWVGVALDADETPTVRVRVEAATPESAEAFLAAMRGGVAMLEAMAQSQAGEADREVTVGALGVLTTQGVDRFEIDGSSLLLEVDAADAAESLLAALGPSLVKARDAARQSVEMSSARQMVVGMHAWADDNVRRRDDRKFVYPESLSVLVDDQMMGVEPLTSPFVDTPEGFDGWDAERKKAWLLENPVWVFVTPGLVIDEVEKPSELVVLFRQPSAAPDQATTPVGFADGHVEALTPDHLWRKLRRQTGKGLDHWDPPAE
ncbi:MAG: hypothetical protein AAF612_12045, partial [Planctomycetota bacterium]